MTTHSSGVSPVSTEIRTLITGGAGFIGSHLAHHLISQGRSLLIIDDLSTGRLSNLASLPPQRYRFIQGRVSDVLTHQSSLLAGITEIYHLAAAVGVQLVVDDPASMIRNNVEETAILLQTAQSIRAAVLIASSSEVYGKRDIMPLSEEDDISFGPTSASRWSYGMAKALDEHLAFSYYRNQNLPAVAVRFFNTIGPRQIGRYGMVVPRFVDAAIRNQPLVIHGTGRQTRSFCDVRDIVAALPLLLGNPAFHGQVFNLGSDREITIEQLADMVIHAASSRSTKQFLPQTDASGRSVEEPVRRVPNIAKARHASGFQPAISLEQTLSHLIHLARQELACPNPIPEKIRA